MGRTLSPLAGAAGGVVLGRPGCTAAAVWRVALIVRHGVKSETDTMPERTPDLVPATPVVAGEPVPDSPSTRPSVDEMGEASFPASDAPAVWTWDPPPPSR
jgi:hypothetical protein